MGNPPQSHGSSPAVMVHLPTDTSEHALP